MQYMAIEGRLYEVIHDDEIENFGLSRNQQPTLRVVIAQDTMVGEYDLRVPLNYCEHCRTVYDNAPRRLGWGELAVGRPVVAAAA